MSRCRRLLILNPSCVASAPGAITFGAKASRTAPHNRAEAIDLAKTLQGCCLFLALAARHLAILLSESMNLRARVALRSRPPSQGNLLCDA